MPPQDIDIRETGPIPSRDLIDLNNNRLNYRFATNDARKKWVAENLSSFNYYKYSSKIKNNKFEDPDIEKTFRKEMFQRRFASLPKDILSQFEELTDYDRDELYRNYNTPEDFLYDYRQKQGLNNLIKERSENIPSREEFLSTLTKEPVISATDINIGNQQRAAELAAKNTYRYINNDGTTNEEKQEFEENLMEKLAPDLSNYYKEMVNGNNKYLNYDDVNWSEITPAVMNQLEAGNMEGAASVFNTYLQGLMADNMGTWNKIGNYSGRFLGNVGLMIPEFAGMVMGLPQAVVETASGLISGEGVEWEDKVATALFDNALNNWANLQNQALMENLPLYDDMMITPENLAFLSSMVIPNMAVGKTFQGIKGLTAASKWARPINKLTGYSKSLQKAEKEVQRVLRNADDPYFRKLHDIEMKGLAEGKSLSEVRALQQEALADIYQTGKIANHQMAAASMIESQQEAIEAKNKILGEWTNRWNKHENYLNSQIFEGNIDVSNEPYSDAEVSAIMRELQSTAQDRFNQFKEAYPDIPDKNLWEAVYQSIEEEAVLRAQAKTYTEREKASFMEEAQRQAAIGGSIDWAENMIILGLTEPLGGWTTRAPGYKSIKGVASEKKNIWNRVRNTMQDVRSVNSTINRMNAQLVFDEATGTFVRKNTGKAVLSKAANILGTEAIEIVQEVLQEGAAAGVEGAGEYNAIDYVLNHSTGPGAEYTRENYLDYLGSFVKYWYHDRTAEDILKLIRDVGLTTALGGPSLSKYALQNYNRFDPNASKVDRTMMALNRYLPVNSPVLQALSENASVNADARTFAKLYNQLLTDSQGLDEALKFSSASMNYAARAAFSASNDNQTAYEDSLHGARLSEAMYLAMTRGKNAAKRVYYENLRDINTQRQGESKEDFEKRRATTLQQLRDESSFNSIKNASDEQLIKWAADNGKQMTDMIDRMSNKINQWYERYDNRINWETLYTGIASEEIANYQTEQNKVNVEILTNASKDIKDTELTEEDKKNRILTESQILAMPAQRREAFINNEKLEGKQKEIVNSLLSQLDANLVKNGQQTKASKLLKDIATREKSIDDNTKILRNVIDNSGAVLSAIRGRKRRRLVKEGLHEILDVLSDKTGDYIETEGNKSRLTPKGKQVVSNAYTKMHFNLSSGEDTKAQQQANMLVKLTLASTNAKNLDLINEVIDADRFNTNSKLNDYIKAQLDKLEPEDAREVNKVLRYIEDELHERIIDDAKILSADNALFNGDSPMTELLKKWLPTIKQWYDTYKANSPEIEVKSTTNPIVTEPTTAKPNPVDNKTQEEDKQEIVNGAKNIIKKRIKGLEKGTLSIKINDNLKAKIEEILNKEYTDVEDIILDLTSLVDENNKEDKRVIEHIISGLDEEEVDIKKQNAEPLSDIIQLVDVNKWIRNKYLRESAFTDFILDKHLQDLIRSGKIKKGTEVYALYDAEFAKEVMRGMTSVDEVFQQRHVPFIAVIKGTIEGYNGSTITIGEETYTPISLFHANSNDNLHSRHVHKALVSRLIGNKVSSDAPFNPENYTTRILSDKDGKPITFTIDHIETGRNETTGNSAIHFSENIQKDFEADDKEKSTGNELKKKARDWFLSHIQIEKKLPWLVVKNPRTKKEYSLPIKIRRISETQWNGTTVSEAIRSLNTAIINDVEGAPVLYRVSEYLRAFLSQDDVKKVIKDFREGKEKNLHRLNSLLNGKYSSLYSRLSLPSGYSYFATYRQEDGREFLDLSFGRTTDEDKTANNKDIAERTKDNVFFSFELPETLGGLYTPPADEQIIQGLKNLLFDKDEHLRVLGNDEMIKWQFDYSDIEKPNETSRIILEELYNSDIFEVQENATTAIYLDSTNAQKQISEWQETAIPENKKEDVDPDLGIPVNDRQEYEEDETVRMPESQKRARALQLELTEDVNIENENLKEFAKQFKWVGLNRGFNSKNNVTIKFIGITEDNQMVVLLNRDDINAQNIIEMKDYFTNTLKMPESSSMKFMPIEDIVKDSEVQEVEDNEVITPKKPDTEENKDNLDAQLTDSQEIPETKEEKEELNEEKLRQAVMEQIKNPKFKNILKKLKMKLKLKTIDYEALTDNAIKKYGSHEGALDMISQWDVEMAEKEFECLL